VARVAAAADALRDRIDAVEREVGGLAHGLRAGTERLRAELADVAAAAGTLGGGAGVPDAVAPAALGATVGAAAAAAVPEDEEVGDEAPAAPQGRSTDVDGARIVALERALGGRPRDETDRYLAEHYDLPDRATLLGEVYDLAAPD